MAFEWLLRKQAISMVQDNARDVAIRAA